MSTTYRLRFYNPAGTYKGELTGSAETDAQGLKGGFLNLAYTRRKNAPGMVYFTLNGRHELLSEIEDKWLIEVGRKPEGLPWSREIVGIYRYGEWNWGADGPVFHAQCPGWASKLAWPIVAWYAGTANRSQFNNALVYDIAEALIQYNASADATAANGRLMDGINLGITFANDANTKTRYWYSAFANLLETLQDLAISTGDDFSVTPGTPPTTADFNWHNGICGTDRSASLIFSVERGNMAFPVYRDNRMNEASVVLAAGQGENDDRDIEVVYGANYAAGNHIEQFVDASDIDKDDLDALTDRAEQKAKEFEATREFQFTAIDSVTAYGVDYDLGDLATAVNPFTGDEYTVQAMHVDVSLDSKTGEEIISPGWATP